MKIFNCLLVWVLIGILLGSCSGPNRHEMENQPASEDELLRFAKANCFFWYFKKNGYDLKDIRAISGGIVETGFYSAARYRNVSLLVEAYAPEISTKHDIDVDLLKCFELERDEAFLNSLEEIRQAPLSVIDH